MKFKWILQSLAMPVVYVSYMIYPSLQDSNLTGLFSYGGAHEVLDVFQLLEKKKILQFKELVLPCSVVLLLPWVFWRREEFQVPGSSEGLVINGSLVPGSCVAVSYVTQENSEFWWC